MGDAEERHRRKHARSMAVSRSVGLAIAGSFAITAAAIAASSVALTGAEPEALMPPSDTPSTSSYPQVDLPAAVPDEVLQGTLSFPVERRASHNVVRIRDSPVIPSPAVAAYRRSEVIMAEADTDCGVEWTTVAAIGLVVSNHGRRWLTHLDSAGEARPRIIGPVLLDNDSQSVADSDGGVLDGDLMNDRVVGPMHLAPTRWRTVSVDADNDGVRNPQDIDDAALATAILLCSFGTNLKDPSQRTNAIERLNPQPAFIALVVRANTAYRRHAEVNGASNQASVVPIKVNTAPDRTGHAPPHYRWQAFSDRWLLSPFTAAPTPVPTDSPSLPPRQCDESTTATESVSSTDTATAPVPSAAPSAAAPTAAAPTATQSPITGSPSSNATATPTPSPCSTSTRP